MHTVKAISQVLAHPAYAALAVISAFVILSLLIWLFAAPQLLHVLQLDQPSAMKWQFFWNAYSNSLIYLDNPLVFTRALVSLLGGITIAVYVYIRRFGQKTSWRKGAGAGIAAMTGAGCVTCGVSLITPLLALFGVSVSAVTMTWVGVLANSLGSVLLLYSLQHFGEVITRFTKQYNK